MSFTTTDQEIKTESLVKLLDSKGKSFDNTSKAFEKNLVFSAP